LGQGSNALRLSLSLIGSSLTGDGLAQAVDAWDDMGLDVWNRVCPNGGRSGLLIVLIIVVGKVL
jgi:hypothetical protein